MPIPNKLIQQFVVQFACRTPIRKQLQSAEKKALENILRDKDPDYFQLFEDPSTANMQQLFQVSKQHVVGASTITMPSLMFSNNSVTLLHPVKIAGQTLVATESLETKEQNKVMSERLFEIQQAIRTLKYQRAGKIFEFVLGPFEKDNKPKLFGKMFSMGLDDVGEVNLAFARYHKVGSQWYNLQTVVGYQQATLEDRFVLTIRVDINNRNLANSLEPVQIVQIWDCADTLIWDHLENVLDMEHTS
jgi:hypothetical protein